ncbi:hypothetical protein MNB_SV-3-266 [hydrothermal vent metagenome]|uniref:Uncharacterized protein n=1 Tax=hydrothermal vent metagenome TaxID=652676 RepID=A0A1W1CT16_9ZZZZ
MLHRKMKLATLLILIASAFMFEGCIPPNEHVGKPAPHTYKDQSYGRGYYYSRPYNGDYYYR